VSPGPSDRERREQEAIVKRLLRDLPYADPSLSGDEPQGSSGAQGSAPRPARPPGPPPRRPPLVGWLWTLLSFVAGAAVPYWPYPRSCGWRLVLYTGVIAALLVVALRAVRVTWRDRVGAAHIAALLVLGWGLALGAEIVLPRVGYAATSASWRCTAPPPPATAPAAPARPAADTLPHPGAADSTGA
jgi:hypothetical protein